MNDEALHEALNRNVDLREEVDLWKGRANEWKTRATEAEAENARLRAVLDGLARFLEVEPGDDVAPGDLKRLVLRISILKADREYLAEQSVELTAENARLWAVVEAAQRWRRLKDDAPSHPTTHGELAREEAADVALDELYEELDAFDVSEDVSGITGGEPDDDPVCHACGRRRSICIAFVRNGGGSCCPQCTHGDESSAGGVSDG